MAQQWIAAIVLACCATNIHAQLNLPVRNIGGIDYYYRIVQKKETIYGISKELGISKDDIIKYNPSVASGLKKDQVLYFPVSAYQKQSLPVRPSEHKHAVKSGETLYGIAKMYGLSVSELLQANPMARTGLKADTMLIIPIENGDSGAVPYTVKPGDTLYRISVNFNVDLKDLLEINPGVSPDNFQAGMTILIPPVSKQDKATSRPETVFIHDKVEKGDSFESISEEYGVSEEQLREANPNVNELKRGATVAVPLSNSTPADSIENANQIYDETSGRKTSDCVNISILLPFESESKVKSKQALFYRDFYRGVLLALNEQHKNERVNLSVYDINAATISTVLQKKDIAESHVIFAPSESALLKQAADFGQKNGINVVNAFSVNDDMCYDNNRIFLVNTPSSYMYTSVRDYIDQTFHNYEIVFLKEEGVDDKPLVEYLNLSNIPHRTVSMSEISGFVCQHPTLFIPTSSSKASLKKIKTLADELSANPINDDKFDFFGYPEWTLYNEYENFLHSNNVTIFSRYSLDESKKIAAKYQYWFGEKPINSIPSMYELGYDVANYFIEAIISNGNDFNKPTIESDGLEVSIKMTRTSNWGGFVNTASYIYKYDSTGRKKIIIR